ncbi:MAG: SAM-dependent methyltransferase [Opitutae bacterium]|nr:SAM-dependent methyltransferase [Opitutae bacterium]
MTAAPRDEFLRLLAASVHDGALVKLTLGKPRGTEPSLENLFVRPVALRGATHYSFLWRHATNDVTKNHPPAEALRQLGELIGTGFHSAHLFTPARTVQLEYNKKGEPRLTFGKAAPVNTEASHDRTKARLLPADSQGWLHALGVTNSAGVVREGLADKHRQIHKFVEILSHLVADANLLGPAGTPESEGRANRSGTSTERRPGEPTPFDSAKASHPAERLGGDASPYPRPLEIADMGCGKGYLTFATHDYFNLVAHRPAHVRGIEFRPELVQLCNDIARDTQRAHLRFEAGTIQDARLDRLDVLIALHACDTATDDALARGLAAGASLLVVAPCCQKELRPQLTAAPVLAPALRHGIFQERHAEFATDALRALLLDWAGYDTKVFEFISTEHTAKNLMIAATKRPAPDAPTLREKNARAIRDLAAFYGIRTQALARHLDFNLP